MKTRKRNRPARATTPAFADRETIDLEADLPPAPRRRRQRNGVPGQPSSQVTALLNTCLLVPTLVEGFCACGCSRELRGRRTRWSTPCCALTWRKNHHWRSARAAAKHRDRYRCVKCGARETPARSRGSVAIEIRLEVNHRVPLVGAPRAESCANHLDNLETLCETCHRFITAAQAQARAARRRAVQIDSSTPSPAPCGL